MAKDDYRLRRVKDVRERAKQEQARVVASRRAALAEAEAELERRRGETERCREAQRRAREQMLSEAQGGAKASAMVAHRAHLGDLREREQELERAVEQQRGVVARREAELEKSLAELAEASKEFQVIERHEQSWRQERRREGERRAQKLNDEIAAILHGRRRSDE
ncbi:MAG TPA: flagellar FliJ family protein [Pyrinomonadaceae bacterium]|nr:flagellar FliJ family protein [Pyrinomonadaceae bacterium]